MSRPRTNTPLQALTLLNDETYVEMAMAFASRILAEPNLANDEQRIDFAFRVALTRPPKPMEVAYLNQFLVKREAALAADQKAAYQLVSSLRNCRMPAGIKAGDLVKWFTLASVLLNLDEAITKG